MNEEPTERRLGWGATTWTFGLIMALLASLHANAGRASAGHASPFAWILAGALGILAVSLLIGVVVWGARGAKPGGGRATFLVLVGLSLLGQLGMAGNSINVDESLRRLSPAQAQWKTTLRELVSDPQLDDSDLSEAQSRLDAPFAALSEEGLFGDGLKLHRASIARMKAVGYEELRIALAMNEFVRAEVLSSRDLDVPGEIERRIAIVQQLIEASRRYEAFQINQLESWEATLRAEGVGARTRRETSAGLKRVLDGRLPILNKLTEARIQWCGVIVEWLDHLHNTQPGWRILDSGSIEFAQGEDAERLDQIGARIDSGAESLHRLEQALLLETGAADADEAKLEPVDTEG